MLIKYDANRHANERKEMKRKDNEARPALLLSHILMGFILLFSFYFTH